MIFIPSISAWFALNLYVIGTTQQIIKRPDSLNRYFEASHFVMEIKSVQISCRQPVSSHSSRIFAASEKTFFLIIKIFVFRMRPESFKEVELYIIFVDYKTVK